MTGEDSYHAACFTCRTCHNRIDELVFAKTSQGFYCMGCHNERVARSRRHAAKQKQKEKDRQALASASGSGSGRPTASGSGSTSSKGRGGTIDSNRVRASSKFDFIFSCHDNLFYCSSVIVSCREASKRISLRLCHSSPFFLRWSPTSSRCTPSSASGAVVLLQLVHPFCVWVGDRSGHELRRHLYDVYQQRRRCNHRAISSSSFSSLVF